MQLLDRLINFKKSELLIFFALTILICLVFNTLPFIKYDNQKLSEKEEEEYGIFEHTK